MSVASRTVGRRRSARAFDRSHASRAASSIPRSVDARLDFVRTAPRSAEQARSASRDASSRDAASRLRADVGRQATDLPPLPFTAPIGAYLDQAQRCSPISRRRRGDGVAVQVGASALPRRAGREVRAAALDLEDAKLVTARSYAFESWADLAAFAERASLDRGIARFESAVDAIVGGDRDCWRRCCARILRSLARARRAGITPRCCTTSPRTASRDGGSARRRTRSTSLASCSTPAPIRTRSRTCTTRSARH